MCEVRAVDELETYLDIPLRRASPADVQLVKRLQSGRLGTYLPSMVAALIAVPIAVTALR